MRRLSGGALQEESATIRSPDRPVSREGGQNGGHLRLDALALPEGGDDPRWAASELPMATSMLSVPSGVDPRRSGGARRIRSSWRLGASTQRSIQELGYQLERAIKKAEVAVVQDWTWTPPEPRRPCSASLGSRPVLRPSPSERTGT